MLRRSLALSGFLRPPPAGQGVTTAMPSSPADGDGSALYCLSDSDGDEDENED